MAVKLLLALALGGWAVWLWERYRSRQLLRRLQCMLEKAEAGVFQEQYFDESVLSALESQMADYLAASEHAAQQLQQERDTIKTLISDISHQTKTPIANILLYAQLLQEQPLPAESADCVRALQVQADKLNFLIASLVKLSRLETGIVAVQPTRQSLAPLLQEIAAMYRPKAEQKDIAFTVAATNVAAVFDCKWTAEALGNVVDNAIKYTPAGGAVTVLVTAYELFCRIDVTDTGPGIAEAEQANIFRRFYRAPQMAAKEGVGIGLYLARQILSAQGGYMKVSSVPGQGAVFSLFLQRQ